MKKLLFLFGLILLLLIGAYLFLTIQWGPHGKGGNVYIAKGSSVEQIAKNLVDGGIIRNVWSFKLLARLEGVGNKLQAGEYEFPAKVTASEVLEKLRTGDRVRRKLVIPEGSNFAQIANLIAGTGIASEAEVQAAFKDPGYLKSLGFPAQSLEGYLFPSTYEYDRGTKLDDLLKTMIQTFKGNITAEIETRRKQGGWTVPQIITLASIIEKETGKAEERPVIASVFHNRLKIGMPLQSDPTIIYGLKNFDGNIRRQDIRNPHPYNTYVHVGLPPGPIASPGFESIRAVLFPAQTDYLFFVAKGDGSHHFSKNLAEHNAAVQRYQLGKTPNETQVPKASPEASPGVSANRPILKVRPFPPQQK